MAIDSIYGSAFRLSQNICILAPGPLGIPYYRFIPDDFCVVAVNKAALIPEVNADVWLVNHSDQEWYQAAHESFDGVRVYRHEAASTARPSPLHLDRCYYYDPPADKLDPLKLERLDDGIIRYGGTVVAAALQLAWHFGGRQIMLCGVDMSGNGYFDSSSNPDSSMQHFHGETWLAAEMLDRLISYLRLRKGLSITTLSPTKLALPLHPITREALQEVG